MSFAKIEENTEAHSEDELFEQILEEEREERDTEVLGRSASKFPVHEKDYKINNSGVSYN